MLNCHTILVKSRHFDFASDLPDFRGVAFPRELQIPMETSNKIQDARLVEVIRDQFYARGSYVVGTSDHKNILKTALSDLRSVNFHGSVGLILFLYKTSLES